MDLFSISSFGFFHSAECFLDPSILCIAAVNTLLLGTILLYEYTTIDLFISWWISTYDE